MKTSLTERCVGKWSSILQAIGMDRAYLTGRHTPCPMCAGRDRFRYINRNGSGDWHCNQEGHGSGMDLAIRFLKSDFKAAAERIEAVLGDAKPDRVRTAPRNDERARLAARRLWQSTIPVSEAGLAYIASRGLPAPPESVVRFLPKCRYDRNTVYPALIAKIDDAQGNGVNLQKLFLTPDGQAKAPVEKPYQMMPGSLPAGSAIRLFEHHGVLGIAEGYFSALAVWELFAIPCWAVLSAAGIKRFVIPEYVNRLVIFGDSDASYTGQAAAYDRANRAVVQDKIEAEVAIPDVKGWDWNDEWMSRQIPRGMTEAA